jgi:hypothetical protein
MAPRPNLISGDSAKTLAIEAIKKVNFFRTRSRDNKPAESLKEISRSRTLPETIR